MLEQKLKVLIVSPDAEFIQLIKDFLADGMLQRDSGLQFEEIATLANAENLPAVDIALIDAESIESRPEERLGKLKAELGDTPIIYFSDALSSSSSLTAVKSLTSDHVLKDHLTGKGLHNCIRWVLHNAQLQLELEQQNRRYQSLFFNAVDPSFFLSPGWEITNINEAFVDIFGQGLEMVEGKAFMELFFDSKDFERISEALEKNQSHIECECQFVRLDRKGRFLGHLKISVLREFEFAGGRTSKVTKGYHGSLSNISYRERLRNIRQRADRVDMTYRLARTLAHEIRNPLTNINLALEQIPDMASLDGNASKMLEVIGRSAGRINELIDQLLTSSERSQLHVNDCELIDLIKEVIEEAKDRADLVNATINIDFEADNFNYPCDTQKIKLAISNLVCNAIESIEGKDGYITIGTYQEDGYLFIYVEDNGKGMSDEVKQSLFDPFFTSKDKGLGLGLTATQTIISEHEGEIEVESAEGYGSTFTISLPIERNNRF